MGSSSGRAGRAAVLPFVVAAAMGFAAAAQATTYYVASTGSDNANGTSPSTAWRTVTRVNHARPLPGDAIRFQGGATFPDATLMPASSGTAAAPIVYGSYGAGAARLTAGVWLQAGDSYLTFDGLDLSNAQTTIVSSAASGAGVDGITVENSVLHDTSAVGIYAQPQDTGWSVVGDTIMHTGDSGIINWSSGMVVSDNEITDTGWNEPALGYATHGVYAKGANMLIHDNDFSRNAHGQSISLRMHGIRVYRNTIHDTPYAIAFFNYDHQQNSGTDYVYANRIWGVSGYVFYYNGETDTGSASGIGIVWDSNTALVTGGGEGVNLSEMTGATAEVANNIFSGSIGSGYRGCGSCREHNNDWSGVAWNKPAGAGDLFVAPRLAAAPSLAPLAGSPVVDRGTVSTQMTYVKICDRHVLDYCGVAPEQGAVERFSVIKYVPPSTHAADPYRRFADLPKTPRVAGVRRLVMDGGLRRHS